MAKGLTMFWKAFPDGKIEVPNAWAAGEYVVVEGKFTGTHTGPLGKMPKTGKKVEMAYAEIFELKDGKIVELWRFWNQADMAKQLGMGGPAKGAAPAKAPDPKM
jgi:predicted ester cyclase